MDKRDKAETGARKSTKPKSGPKGLGESMFAGEGATGIKIRANGVLV